MRKVCMLASFFSAFATAVYQPAWAADCEGVAYGNPQLIQGNEAQKVGFANTDLRDFLKSIGAPDEFLGTVAAVTDLGKLKYMLSQGKPKCFIYANPVLGLGAGDSYVPLSVGKEKLITASVLYFGEVTNALSKPALLESFPASKQAEVLASLKKSICYGVNSGVTTAMVYGSGVCGKVEEISPKEGRGQNYLPIAATFYQAARTSGAIMRDTTASRFDPTKTQWMRPEDSRRELVVVPTSTKSWGYGLYAHKSVPDAVKNRLKSSMGGLTTASASLAKVLDTDTSPVFGEVNSSDVEAMRKVLQAYLAKPM